MIGRIIPSRKAVDTLTRLNCCAALLIGIIGTMQDEGAPQSSLLSLVGACDLLEAIIQDFFQAVDAAERVSMKDVSDLDTRKGAI